jgi:hypothetical protein
MCRLRPVNEAATHGAGIKPKPVDREVEVATADAQCISQTGVDEIWNSLEAAYQQREIAKDPQKWNHARQVYKTHYGRRPARWLQVSAGGSRGCGLLRPGAGLLRW